MRVAKGKSVSIEIDFWPEVDGNIHVTSRELPGFHVAVSNDPSKPYGHPTLYRRLRALLDKGDEIRRLEELDPCLPGSTAHGPCL